MKCGGGLAVLVGGEHEGLILDRPGAQQHLPVIAAGRQGEGRGNSEDLGAADGKDAEELGEAQVVTNAEADRDLLDGLP